MDNVNNLNGVPNFGHGWPEEETEVTEEVSPETVEAPEETKDAEVELPEVKEE